MKTNYNYINEYREFDIFNESLISLMESAETEYNEYRQNITDMEISLMFESSMDREFMIESEKESFLGSIGNKFIKLIESIANFIRKIGEKILGITRKVESERDIVQKMIEEHPELKKEIAHGIKEEWFTYKDVATYENDVIGLINMIEQGKIDNKTAWDKFTDLSNKFAKSAAPIITVGSTVLAVVGVTSKILGAVHQSQKKLGKIKKTAEKAKNAKDPNKQNLLFKITNAFSSNVAAEIQLQTKGANKLDSFLTATKTRFNKILGKDNPSTNDETN